MNKFELNQKVKIVATNREGVINSIWMQRESAVKYEVVYYDDTERRVESWMLEGEIDAI